MQLIDMSDYNRGVRTYWCATTIVGIACVGMAARDIARFGRVELLELILLMAVTVGAGLCPIRIPGTQSFITPSDVFVFLGAIFFGPAAATLVAVTDSLATSWRKSKRWTSRVGGPALMAIAISVAAGIFQYSLHWLKDSGFFSSGTLQVALLLFAIIYFLLNSLLTATHQALKRRVSLFSLWWSNYFWTSLTYLASASAAGLIYLAIIQYGITSLFAAVPLVAIIFATCYFYFRQADERSKAAERVGRLHLSTVEALATAIDAKDQITHDHVYRVQVYACGLARHFGLSDPEIEALKAGALLHDIGKIAVPDYILNKPGRLTAAEFEKMKLHTVVGAQVLDRVDFPYPVVPIVRHHHERWDGHGYPDGLAGEEIPMTARILSVVDCFDAIREDRQYRNGMGREQSCQFLLDNSGSQFDPSVVDAFLSNLSIFEEEIVAHKASAQVFVSPSTQAGLAESARKAVPAAGLAPSVAEPPEYVKQIHAVHAEVAALYEMAQSFSARLDVCDVVTLTVNRIERMIPFTTCVVYLREKDGCSFAAYAFGENADQIRGKRLAAGHGIAEWVTINGCSMSNTDPMLDLRQFLPDNRTGYRAVAVFPLTGVDQALGALALYSSEMPTYSADQLRLIESVSRVTSTALQHAIAHEETKISARTDALTGLPNGRALYEQFEMELALAKERGTSLTVVCLNLTGLRAVNDSFGYQTGDRVLAEIAGRLRRVFGESPMLSRIAGDEFICVLSCPAPNEAMDLAVRAQSAVEGYSLEARPGLFARVGMSFGLSDYPGTGNTVDELLQTASAASRLSNTAREQAHRTSTPFGYVESGSAEVTGYRDSESDLRQSEIHQRY
jgi:diguanylate cyclase (GGDEF)-like protein/putative nucleotidyltransferase with HDIG domain